MKRIDAAISLLVAGFFCFLYFITTNQIFSFDAITNALACEINEPLRWFHPNHPLYPALGVAYYRLEHALGYNGYSIYSLARFNSLLAALALSLLYWRMSSVVGRWQSLLLVFFTGSCYCVWNYAVDGRAIGISFLFSTLVITQMISMTTQKHVSLKSVLVLGLASALYVLSHGIAIFHVVPLAWWLYKSSDAKEAVIYGLFVFASVALVYLSIYFAVVHPITKVSFTSWVLGYAAHHDAAGSGFWTSSLKIGLKGLWDGWKNSFLGPVVIKNSFHSFFAAVVGLLAVGILISQWIRHRKDTGPFHSLQRALMGWGALVMVFLSVWSPGQEGFRLHVIIPWLVSLWILSAASKTFCWGAGVTAVLIFVFNLTGPLGYAATIKNNEGFQSLTELSGSIAPGDLFLSAKGSYVPNFEVLGPYFFPQIKGGSIEGRMFAFKENSLDPLKERLKIQQAEKHHIYWGEDVLNPFWQQSLEMAYSMKPGTVRSFLEPFKLKESFRLSSGQKIYVATNN